MDIHAHVFCLLAFQTIVQCAGECMDLDPLACVQMASQNPSICQGSIATSICPSFCGTCTPTCYDCTATHANYTSCTTVKTCQTGEKCVLISSQSKYVMDCASQQVCSILSRRELGIRSLQTATCCSSDRCNFPSPTTTVAVPTTKVTSTTKVPATTTPMTTTTTPTTMMTTTTTPTPTTMMTTTTTPTPTTMMTTTTTPTTMMTTTTTPTPTTPMTTTTTPTTMMTTTTTPTPTTMMTTTTTPTTMKPNQTVHTPVCNRDIEIMVQDSRDIIAPALIKQYLKDLVNNMEIGTAANKIGIALYDSSVHNQISLANHNNRTQMITAIDDLTFRHRVDNIDKRDVTDFLEDKILKEHVGDRRAYPNVVIILVDHTDVNDIPISGRSVDKTVRHTPDTIAKDVIIINVGVENSQSPFSNMATDANHVINAYDIHDLSSTLPKLLELICL